jgi:uncharacterized membrane protein YedE/YeeE
MKTVLLSFAAGLVFALGLGISGMADPQNVAGFLDVAGEWNPSLMFVMVSAIGVHAIAWRVSRTRARPVWGERFHVPANAPIDRRLVTGAAVFGVGWGLSGVCPGPGIVAASTLAPSWLVFVGSMVIGMALYRGVRDAGFDPTRRAVID